MRDYLSTVPDLMTKVHRQREEAAKKEAAYQKRKAAVFANWDKEAQGQLRKAIDWVYAGYVARYDEQLGRPSDVQACEAQAAHYIRASGLFA